MTSLTKNKSIDELFTLLSESSRMERICQADRDAILIAIFKKQQETIEKNQKTIKEQKELIEALWAWAEEKEEEEESVCSDGEESQTVAQYLLDGHGYEAYEDGGEEDEDESEEKDGEDDDDFRDIASSFGTQYIDYTNFKLCDEYCGERVGFVYLKGIHGPGYYALKK